MNHQVKRVNNHNILATNKAAFEKWCAWSLYNVFQTRTQTFKPVHNNSNNIATKSHKANVKSSYRWFTDSQLKIIRLICTPPHTKSRWNHRIDDSPPLFLISPLSRSLLIRHLLRTPPHIIRTNNPPLFAKVQTISK